MSDILIKGMEMPTSCLECYEKGICNYIHRLSDCPLCMEENPAKWVLKNKLHHDCPLIEVPNHGRLIDADVYEKYLEEHWIPANYDVIKAQPTVIPAEEGET